MNRSHRFPRQVDFNFDSFGKLWQYNLNYFSFLNQNKTSFKEDLGIVQYFCSNLHTLQVANEPYPTSLRIINFIKFLCREKHRVNDTDVKSIERCLYSQVVLLRSRLEYHLLGNHLLENAFALFFAAYYFNDEGWYKKATGLLNEELNEQIFARWGSFLKLSPMYHIILLNRLLDCLNLTQNSLSFADKNSENYFITKAEVMLGWLEQMVFSKGSIPMVNDSAYDIAPAVKDIFAYAKRLNLAKKRINFVRIRLS